MICYKDRAWCCNPNCDNSCGRQFTEEDHKAAVRWWGSEDYPISVADFCTKENKDENN